jgi:hypothetical protein
MRFDAHIALIHISPRVPSLIMAIHRRPSNGRGLLMRSDPIALNRQQGGRHVS